MALLIDSLNPEAKIIINGFLGGAVEGFLSQDFHITGAADYQTPEGSAAQQKFSDTVNSIKKTVNRFGGNSVQTQLKNIHGTILDWQGTQNFQMTLPFLFVATRRAADVRTQVKIMMAALYPEIEGGNFFGKLVAPNRYVSGKAGTADGAVSIHIGKWFKTEQVFLINGCDFTFSKETMEDTGYPLWAQGSASFISYRLLGTKEVQGYFT